jgi:F-type H+-transporting ATPase subunit b
VRFRTRAILASVLLAVGLVAFAPLASAQDTTGGKVSAQQTKELGEEGKQAAEDNGSSKADAECVTKLVKGGKVDDCQEAPSPILPETSELVWAVLSFAVLFFLIWKLALPAVKEGMEKRTARIKGDLDAAEAAKNDATGVLDDYRAQLADAKQESARIIEEARQAADALKRDHEARLQTEIAELRARAAADIESAKAQAIADLRGDVAQLAIGAAEVVVRHNLDQATQTQLIEDYINQVASRA